jgi:hypothetical protein
MPKHFGAQVPRFKGNAQRSTDVEIFFLKLLVKKAIIKTKLEIFYQPYNSSREE